MKKIDSRNTCGDCGGKDVNNKTIIIPITDLKLIIYYLDKYLMENISSNGVGVEAENSLWETLSGYLVEPRTHE